MKLLFKVPTGEASFPKDEGLEMAAHCSQRSAHKDILLNWQESLFLQKHVSVCSLLKYNL
jgi:hypothetical protein